MLPKQLKNKTSSSTKITKPETKHIPTNKYLNKTRFSSSATLLKLELKL